jgi:hypothetical protein
MERRKQERTKKKKRESVDTRCRFESEQAFALAWHSYRAPE